MADTPILNYKGKYDGPEIDKAVELALGLENPKSCPYYIHVSLSQPDYVLTIGLRDAEGNPFNHAEIDLPLESMVVNATYSNGNIILHLQDGTTTEPIPISALIAGLVSETRTIAGIDLRDDITPKELRDALSVYTKDSVDQLVSELENTINETLNDLSELTSEHDTQIKKNVSDIATNKITLGTRSSKNIFNGIFEQGNIAGSTGGNSDSIKEYFIRTKDYVFVDTSIKSSDGVCYITISQTSHVNNFYAYFYDEDKNILSYDNKTSGSETRIERKIVSFAVPDNAVYLRYKSSGSGGETKYTPDDIQNAQIEYDSTATSYEPYKPSVNERLVEVEESVSELTPQMEQNKSDILKAESEIEYNKIKWGRVLASGLPSGTAGWYKIASCELAVPSESTTRNATFLISHHSGTWGILKNHIIINPSNVSKFVMTSITQGINAKNIIGIAKRVDGVQKCEIWCKCTYAGEYYRFVILDNGSSGIPNNYDGFWQLRSTTAYQTNEPSDYDNKAETTDVIKDLSDRITALEAATAQTE